jgi:hypothetical protein
MPIKQTSLTPAGVDLVERVQAIAPQTQGVMVHDPNGHAFGIQTPDGRMVLLDAVLAHRWALEILSVTAFTLPPARAGGVH